MGYQCWRLSDSIYYSAARVKNMMSMFFKNNKESRGFTLVETLVALTIFALVGGLGVNFLLSGLSAQRQALESQGAMDEISFVMEYMARALREARKDLGNPLECLDVAGNNYEAPVGRVRFLDKGGVCRDFYLNTGDHRLYELRKVGVVVLGDEALTSDNLEVTKFLVALRGRSQTDNEQPRVTLALEVKIIGKPDKLIQVETTLSQRRLDIVEN